MKLIKHKTIKQKRQASASFEDQYPDRVTDACLYALVALCVLGVASAIIFSFIA